MSLETQLPTLGAPPMLFRHTCSSHQPTRLLGSQTFRKARGSLKVLAGLSLLREQAGGGDEGAEG